MTVREAAQRLEVSTGTVYLLCSQGLLEHARIGTGRGTIRISEQQLSAYLLRAQQPLQVPAGQAGQSARSDWRTALRSEQRQAKLLMNK